MQYVWEAGSKCLTCSANLSWCPLLATAACHGPDQKFLSVDQGLMGAVGLTGCHPSSNTYCKHIQTSMCVCPFMFPRAYHSLLPCWCLWMLFPVCWIFRKNSKGPCCPLQTTLLLKDSNNGTILRVSLFSRTLLLRQRLYRDYTRSWSKNQVVC